MLTLPPLSLYIHIPWCIRKCPYCDFNSHQRTDNLPEADYVTALCDDLQADAHLAQSRRLSSIFFGGGTPSLFSAAAIDRILQQVEAQLGFTNDIEITLEANPGTFEQARFADYRAAGVNRLSIGVQSFADAQLEALGRIHNGEAARQAVTMARRAGFDNLNLDIMHGLPGQTLEGALADVQQALALEPEHLSWYQLSLEPNTVFYNNPPVLPVEDTLVDIQDAGHELLQTAGFQRYEVSAYARGPRARHNLNYWEFGDYLGIGAGAHGKITLPGAEGEVVREWKTRLPEHYLAAADKPPRFANPYTAGRQLLTAEALPLEFMLNALRLADGCPPDYFTSRTGLSLEALEPQWQRLQARGLVYPKQQHLGATELGQRFLNDVLGEWL